METNETTNSIREALKLITNTWVSIVYILYKYIIEIVMNILVIIVMGVSLSIIRATSISIPEYALLFLLLTIGLITYLFQRKIINTLFDQSHLYIIKEFDIIKAFIAKSLILILILTISMITTALVVGAYLILTYLLLELASNLGLSRDAALLTINTISQAQFSVVFTIITIITTITTIKLIKKEAA